MVATHRGFPEAAGELPMWARLDILTTADAMAAPAHTPGPIAQQSGGPVGSLTGARRTTALEWPENCICDSA